jgi:hypothetical protein
MTEYLAAIALSFATATLLRQFGLSSFEKVAEAISQLVGGWRGDGWPRGVQEEDRDRPWGRAAATSMLVRARDAFPDLTPALSRVRPVIRAR